MAFLKDYAVIIDACSFDIKLKLSIVENLTLRNCFMDNNGFSPCNDYIEKIFFFAPCVYTLTSLIDLAINRCFNSLPSEIMLTETNTRG